MPTRDPVQPTTPARGEHPLATLRRALTGSGAISQAQIQAELQAFEAWFHALEAGVHAQAAAAVEQAIKELDAQARKRGDLLYGNAPQKLEVAPGGENS